MLALNFKGDNPRFNETAKKMEIQDKNLTIYYTPQCPYTMNCIEQIEEYSKENNAKINFEKIDTLEKAKNVPCVFNNWANFKDGKFLSNSLLNKNMVSKLYD